MTTYPIEKKGIDIQANKAVILTSVGKKYSFAKNKYAHANIDVIDLWALKDISLEVNQGEILGIIGRNGAGKTTLLNIISGVLSPAEGKALVVGKVLGLFNLGIGFQDELTGRENIFLNGAIIGASKKELEGKLNTITEFSELGEFINMPLGTYSQGMRLRLAFSIIANLDFDILVIDEVLAVGDTLFQSKCFQRLMDFRRAGKTLIITTQSMGLIERLCDKAVLLDHGRLLFYGGTIEGTNKYQALLNKEEFFVGPIKKNAVLVKNTKKWAEDISEWGRKLGTKEVIIESVGLRNKFGLKTDKIKSRDPLAIKVHFRARNAVKEPYFGVAIFRNDGVYCYGPNTLFDGHDIPELKEGKGYFILNLHKILLAPGEYRLSVAIWDKNETLAYDYHCGFYKLIITGRSNAANGLLNLPFNTDLKGCIDRLMFFKNWNRFKFNFNSLTEHWQQKIDFEGIRLASVKFLNFRNELKDIFMANEPVRFSIAFSELKIHNKHAYLWLGVYRDDRVYCQGVVLPVKKNKNFNISFAKLPLLPGEYRISVGILDGSTESLLFCHHGIYRFKIVFNQQDHGTVYLEHKWKWKLP